SSFHRNSFNNPDTISFIHPRPAEISALSHLFQSQGFLTRIGRDMDDLVRLSMSAPAAVIVAHAARGEESRIVTSIKSVARTSRLYLVTDSSPSLEDAVRAARY